MKELRESKELDKENKKIKRSIIGEFDKTPAGKLMLRATQSFSYIDEGNCYRVYSRNLIFSKNHTFVKETKFKNVDNIEISRFSSHQNQKGQHCCPSGLR